MRLVLDTNVLVSAFLWQGTPGRLVELAGEKECRLFTSRVLIEELSEVLQRKKLAKQVQATGLTAAQMLRNYQRLSTTVTARRLAQQVSRDADDDYVLACALAVQVDLIVSGDADLLVIKQFQGIRIVTAAQALKSRAQELHDTIGRSHDSIYNRSKSIAGLPAVSALQQWRCG